MRKEAVVSHVRGCLAMIVLATALVATSKADNFMHLIVTRTDDFQAPLDYFALEIEVSVPDVPGITAVDVAIAGGGSFALNSEGSGSWFRETSYADLATMQADVDGTWTVNISGTDPSSSSFTLQAGLLQDSDWFATATGLSPPNGSTGVSASSTVSWVPPTGGASADGLFLDVDGNNNNYQGNDSVLGTLSTSDTSWTPPQALGIGPNDFKVGYYNLDSAFITPLNVLFGSVNWGDSPYAPAGYALQTPLLALGSETVVSFDVVPEPGSLALLACGGLGSLIWQLRMRRRLARAGFSTSTSHVGPSG